MSQQIRVRITETTIVTQKGVLRALNVEIAERRKYHREQEKIINELVEAGNTRLMGLNHDIELAKKELRELKTDVRKNIREKVLLTEDLGQLRKELEQEVKKIEQYPGLANAYA